MDGLQRRGDWQDLTTEEKWGWFTVTVLRRCDRGRAKFKWEVARESGSEVRDDIGQEDLCESIFEICGAAAEEEEEGVAWESSTGLAFLYERT